MPVTMTLKNIPDDVYARLKTISKANRRSLNSEAIICFETALIPAKMSSADRIHRARELRATCGAQTFKAKDIAGFKRQGRP
jgi:hypothetical protein